MDGAKMGHAAVQHRQPAVGLTLIKEHLLSPQALHETCLHAVRYLWGTYMLPERLHGLAIPGVPSLSRQVE